MAHKVEAILSAIDGGFNRAISGALGSLDKLESSIKSVDDVNFSGIGKQLDKIGSDVSKTADKFSSAGEKMNKGLTVPLLAAGGVAGKVASDFESANVKMQNNMGTTAQEAEKVGQIAENVFTDGWGESLDGVATAIIEVDEQLAGLQPDELQEVTKEALALEQTFGMDMTESLRGVNALMEAYGLTASEAMDYMAAGAQRGLDKTDELGDNLAEYATLFEQNGYSADEMFSTLQAGLDAGAYNLDKVNDLVKEFGIRVGDGTIKDAVAELGGSWEQIYADWEKAGGTNDELFRKLGANLASIEDPQEKQMALSAIWGSIGEDAGLKVVEAMAAVEDSYGGVNGAMDEVVAKQEATFGQRFLGMLRELQTALYPLGEALLTAFSAAIPYIEKVANWIRTVTENMSGMQLAVTVGFGAFLAVLGPVFSLIGMFLSPFGKMITGFGTLATNIGKAGGIMPYFSGVLSSVMSPVTMLWGGIKALGVWIAGLGAPILIAVGAFAVFIAGLVYMWNTSEEFRAGVTTIFNAVKDAISQAIQAVSDFVMQIWGTLVNWWNENNALILEVASIVWNNIMTVISGILAVIVPIVMNAWTIISGATQLVWNSIKGAIQIAMELILGVITVIMQIITGDWAGAWETIKTVALNIWNIIKETISNAINIVKETISNSMEIIKGVWSAVWNVIKEVASSVWESIKTNVSNGIENVRSVIETVMNVISTVWGVVWNVIKAVASAVWTNIKEDVSNKINAVKTVITTVMNVISTVWNAVWNVIKTVASVIWEGITSGVTSAINGVKNTITTVMNAIQSVWNAVWNAIKNIAIAVWNGIKTVITNAINGVKMTIDAVLNTIKSIWNATWNGIKSLTSTVWNGIKSTISNAINSAKDTISSVLNTIKSTFSNIFNSLSGTVSSAFSSVVSAVAGGMQSAYDKVTGWFDTFKSAGSNLVGMIADGISGAIGKVTGAIGDVVGAVRDFLPFSPAKVGPLSDLDELNFGGTISDGIYDGEREVTKAMNSILGIPELSGISVSDSIDSMNGEVSQTVDHNVKDNLAQSKPATINLNIGGRTYRAFVEDISDEQGDLTDLELLY